MYDPHPSAAQCSYQGIHLGFPVLAEMKLFNETSQPFLEGSAYKVIFDAATIRSTSCHTARNGEGRVHSLWCSS